MTPVLRTARGPALLLPSRNSRRELGQDVVVVIVIVAGPVIEEGWSETDGDHLLFHDAPWNVKAEHRLEFYDARRDPSACISFDLSRSTASALLHRGPLLRPLRCGGRAHSHPCFLPVFRR